MADLVMVGAGPQALALSCLLLQKRSRLHRRLRIVDPSSRCCSSCISNIPLSWWMTGRFSGQT